VGRAALVGGRAGCVRVTHQQLLVGILPFNYFSPTPIYFSEWEFVLQKIDWGRRMAPFFAARIHTSKKKWGRKKVSEWLVNGW
jgi:hypothetical protein